MLKLGIPCICIDLLGISLQVTNTWAFIPDPIIPDIQCMAVNEWDGNGEGKPAIANGRLNSLFISNNRWSGTADLPIPTFTVTPAPDNSRNNWDNNADARELRTLPLPLNVWANPGQAFNDIRIQITNEWTVTTTIRADIEVSVQNIWLSDIAAINLFASELPRNNNWNNTAFQSQADTFVENNWVFENVFAAQAEGSNINDWDNTLNNKEIEISILTNSWTVETFAKIEGFALNSWVPMAGNAIIPTVMVFPVNNWDANGSLPIPINQSVLNNWTANATMIRIIRSNRTNSFTNTGSSFSINIEVSNFNEWSVDAELPDLVITAVGEFINQWDTNIEIEGQVIEICPVPCGSPSTSLLQTLARTIKIGIVEQI